MKQNISIFDSLKDLSNYFWQSFEHIAKKAAGQDSFISVLLSGGSTPKQVFAHLPSHVKKSIHWNKIKFFWGDERCVPPDHDESNYKMAKEFLLKQIPVPVENTFRIRGENNPVEEAKRYSITVQKELTSISGVPRFDLIMLGIGEDGHIASIFPNQIELFHSNEPFVVTKHPSTGQNRISATGQILNNALHVHFLVTGTNKAGILPRILEERLQSHMLPASLVRPMQGELKFLLDNLSASQLKESTWKS